MADAGAGEKLKVFLSYSHKDSATFADELAAGLDVAGFAPFVDRHDIAAGEASDARVMGVIFSAIIGGMLLTLIVAYLVFT